MRTLVILVALFASSVQAEVIELTPVDFGWFREDGRHVSSRLNHITGYLPAPTSRGILSLEYRNFFVFDLGQVDNKIVAAELVFYTYNIAGEDQEFLVSGNTIANEASVLANDYGEGSQAGISIFEALGTGTAFGSAVSPGRRREMTVQLNGQAVTALRATDGLFDFSGRISNLPRRRLDFHIFADSEDPNRGFDPILRLQVIPIPAAVWLFMSAMGLLGWIRSRAVAAQ